MVARDECSATQFQAILRGQHKMQLFVALMLLHASTIVTSAPDIYYVWPSSATHCPDLLCLTIDMLVQQTNVTADTTFVLLAGNHSMTTALNLEDISNITLQGEDGEDGAFVIMRHNSTISCKNVSNFHLKAVTFVLGSDYDSASALEFSQSEYVLVYDSTFLGSEDTNLTLVRAITATKSAINVTGCQFRGNTGVQGGAILTSESHMRFSGNTFDSNQATVSGGAIHATDKSHLVLAGNNSFIRNRAILDIGGAVTLQQSTLLISGGHNEFSSNRASFAGGAIYCAKGNITLMGNCTFTNNHLTLQSKTLDSKGGAIKMDEGHFEITSGTALFATNRALVGGAIYLRHSTAVLGGTEVVFFENMAEIGGGLALKSSNINTTTHQLKFSNNIATVSASAITIRDNTDRTYPTFLRKVVLSASFTHNRGECGIEVFYTPDTLVTFKDLHITGSVGSAVCIHSSNVTFTGITRISNSTSRKSGGGIHCTNSYVQFTGTTVFSTNSAAVNGGAIHSLYGTLSLHGNTDFVRNRAGKYGGALYTLGTTVDTTGVLILTSNSAQNGGAMYFKPPSSLTLVAPVSVFGSSNRASDYGGVIYHEDIPTPSQCNTAEVESKTFDLLMELPHCFLQVERHAYAIQDIVGISTDGDSVGENGIFLYGGLLDKCQIKSKVGTPDTANRTILSSEFTRVEQNSYSAELTKYAITSPPYLLSFCDDDEDRLTDVKNIAVYRGQRFTVSLLAQALRKSFTSTEVTSVTSNTASLELHQESQTLAQRCSNLTYSVYSATDHEEITLYPDGPCRDTGLATATINVTILPCPKPFTQHDDMCVCEERLHAYGADCVIDDTIHIIRKAGSRFWMDVEHTSDSREALILYKTCPVEYCKTAAVNITLDNLDIQCALNRSGLLCGACATNYSLVLGSSQCQVCSNVYLTLLLPFAAAGIILVSFLTFTRLTVATGVINSIILYSNIVQVNKKTFFPINTVDALTVFIAWMNLDLGFHTCFYDGMDAYAQTWLQFAFPLYIWILVGLIILASRYSITVSKLIGHNPIAVLATLLLMSYTKILRIIIDVYSSVNLDYPDNKTVTVWLKDANVPYLQSKHLILTVVISLVLVFLFLPYTLLLLLGHKLYQFSGRKYLHWLSNIKPLLDSYYAPYNTHTRYWPGLQLLVRCALYIVFSFDSSSQRATSLLAIIITFGLIRSIAYLTSRRIYKKRSVNFLEFSVNLNLIILSSLALAEVGNGTPLVYILVGLVCTATIVIIAHQLFLRYVSNSARWLNLKAKLCTFSQRANTEKDLPSVCTAQVQPQKIISTTTVELREPLLV